MSKVAARMPAPLPPSEAEAALAAGDEEAFERAMAAAEANPKDVDDDVVYAVPARPADPTVEQLEAEIAELELLERKRMLMQKRNALKMQVKESNAVRAAAVPEHDPVRDSEKTWIVMPFVGEEAAIAEAWIEAHCPVKKEQRAMETVLPLSQLRIDDSVMTLARGKGMRAVKPLMTVVTSQQGEKLSTPRLTEELMEELVLTPVIHVKDHWIEGGGFGRYSGQLNRATFLEALGKVCVPLMPRFLDVTRKEGNPDLLVLRSL